MLKLKVSFFVWLDWDQPTYRPHQEIVKHYEAPKMETTLPKLITGNINTEWGSRGMNL